MPIPPHKRIGVDAESLLQWAVERTGRLPWHGIRDMELSYNQGLTARPRRRPIVEWEIAEACAGIRHNGRPLLATRTPSGDAETVLSAIKHLDPAIAAIVIACARSKIRPDWMEGVVPIQVKQHKRHRTKHRRVTVLVWKPCDPQMVLAARDVYSRWHHAVSGICDVLNGMLEEWEITGFVAPQEPWA